MATAWFIGGRLVRALQAPYPRKVGLLVEWWDSLSDRGRSSMTIGTVLFCVSVGCLETARDDLSRRGEILALVLLTAGAAQFAYGLALARS